MEHILCIRNAKVLRSGRTAFIFRFLVPKLRSVAQNEWKKTPIYIFSTFGSKINEFERKKSEKNEKIPKT